MCLKDLNIHVLSSIYYRDLSTNIVSGFFQCSIPTYIHRHSFLAKNMSPMSLHVHHVYISHTLDNAAR